MMSIPHSCEDMLAALADPSTLLRYSPRTRDFHILTMPMGEVLPAEWPTDRLAGWIVMEICFCPWCGDLLPGALNVQYFDIFFDEYGLDDYDAISSSDALPEELRSDAWWRRREIGPTADLKEIRGYAKLREGDRYEVVQPDFTSLPGYQVPHEAPPHLCRSSLRVILRNTDMYTYVPETGEFGIRVIDPKRAVDHQPIRVRAVRFCPWCGDELPKSKLPG